MEVTENVDLGFPNDPYSEFLEGLGTLISGGNIVSHDHYNKPSPSSFDDAVERWSILQKFLDPNGHLV